MIKKIKNSVIVIIILFLGINLLFTFSDYFVPPLYNTEISTNGDSIRGIDLDSNLININSHWIRFEKVNQNYQVCYIEDYNENNFVLTECDLSNLNFNNYKASIFVSYFEASFKSNINNIRILFISLTMGISILIAISAFLYRLYRNMKTKSIRNRTINNYKKDP